METQKVTCVTCPVGCEIEVDYEMVDGEKVVREVRNNKCQRGFRYASAEVVCPERILTSTVAIEGAEFKRLPVRSEKPVPKSKMFDCMAQISALTVKSPVEMGQVLIENVAGTGVNIIATRSL